MDRPTPAEHAPYFEQYLRYVTELDILAVLDKQPADVRALLAQLSDTQAGTRYAPEKWSVKEVLGHLIDSERIFGYRALCFARGEKKSLPGFEENDYAKTSGHDQCRISDLVDEFELARKSNVAMFEHLPEEAWLRTGIANENKVSVRALAFVLVGHTRHHLEVLRSKYGVTR